MKKNSDPLRGPSIFTPTTRHARARFTPEHVLRVVFLLFFCCFVESRGRRQSGPEARTVALPECATTKLRRQNTCLLPQRQEFSFLDPGPPLCSHYDRGESRDLIRARD